MVIFSNIFLKTFAFFLSISAILILVTIILNFVDKRNINSFFYVSGDKKSLNTIAIIELSGLIMNKNNEFSELTSSFIISPYEVQTYLDDLKKTSPKVIIFSINSPGGTVSASKNLYDVIKNFKKKNDVEILFHTNELLASGGYWISSAADQIYASYGSIIGSIGVKGPDWIYYDQPISISNGIFGNTIETKREIKLFTSIAGRSKDIFNPFRKPTNKELAVLQNMVDEIYDDFIRLISKERKIEINTITNDIGALIFTSSRAKNLHLIDGEIGLDNLIKKKIREKKFTDHKIIKTYRKKNSLLKEILTGHFFKKATNLNYACITLRSSISVILSYKSSGC